MNKSFQMIKMLALGVLSVLLVACTSNGFDGTYEATQDSTKMQLVIKDTTVKGEASIKEYNAVKLNVTGSVNKEKKQITLDLNILGTTQTKTLNYEEQSNGDLVLFEEGKTEKITFKKVK